MDPKRTESIYPLMSSQRTNGDPAALKARRSSSQGGRRESSATNDNSDSETDSGYPPSVTLSPTGALPEPATSDQIHETSSSTAMKRPHRSISSSSGQARPSSTSSKGHHSPPSLLASPSGTLRSKLSNSPECLEVDPTTLEIREHIESMIEKLIDGSLDEAPIGDLSSITEYQTLKSRFLYEISEGLARLGYALQICLNNEPSDRSEEFVPSVIHSALSTLIQEMELEAEKLPLMLLTLDGETCPEESLALQTYEDLLSSAIINKAVLKHQACLIPKIDTAKELLLAEKIVISDDGGGTSPSVDDKEEEDVDDKEDEGPSVDDKEEEDEREIHCREKQEDRVDVDVSVEEISTNGLDENVQTEKVKAMDEVKESVEVTSCHEELEETISSAEKVECDSAPEEIMEENEAVEKPSDKGESAVENGVSEERVEKSSSFTTTNHPEQSEEAVDHDVSSGELAEVKVERPKPAASFQEQEDEDVESDTTTSDLVSLDTDSSVESTDRFVPQKGVHYIVEESLLEEITTAYDTDDSEAGKLTPIEKKWTRIRKGPTPQSPKLTRRVVTRTRTYRHPLNGESSSSTIEFLYDPLLEPQTPRKVIFPELGVDLISEPSQRAKNLMRRQAQNRSSWSENWIFQPRDEEDHSAGLLRRFSFGESSERSIPMLVPHPREKQFRSPRVGGRDVHELSDLSDEMFPDVSSGSSSSSSSRTSSPERSAATTTVFLEPKLHHGSPGSGSGESSSTPVSVPNSQRESEYTEDYEALAQISKPPTSHPVPRPRKRSMQPAFLGPSSRPPVSPTNPIVFITAPGNSYLHVGQHLSLSYSVVIREDDEWSGELLRRDSGRR
ncbi:unnamed protein product [Cyprideis torosa]|uniref:Uncharacterized protein n=1 Tax=Cyprideis torosa TaxID=163714 RepID=A0A7R8WFQ9_9CRUS|nr:unnamed protein product [Cyprideis torosa]CAG0891219.1 unnamed protein product [Cyprideis torosa]